MADNVAITAGSGTTIACDEVTDGTLGSCKVQIVKVMDGTLDSTNKMVVDSSGRVTVTATSGSIASGAIASGAVASGAVASGAFASGAIGSGAIASGAVASGAFASGALASGSIAAGAIATGATSIAANEDDASANADTGVKILARQTAAPANTAGTDGDYEMLQISNGRLWVSNIGSFVTVSTSVTRPADTNVYAVNDTFADSTSAPTTGGFTLTSAARKSGGSGIITDAVISTSNNASTTLSGEVWIFDQSATATNDNAAFTLSSTDILKVVAVIPFTMGVVGATSLYAVSNLSYGFTASGSANLRFLVRVKNAYTPASSEVLQVRLKILQID